MSNDNLSEKQYYQRYYEDYQYNETENYYFKNPSQFIPRIEGTELEVGIAFLNLRCLPILTSRRDERRIKYYLFDFIKIWQVNE